MVNNKNNENDNGENTRIETQAKNPPGQSSGTQETTQPDKAAEQGREDTNLDAKLPRTKNFSVTSHNVNLPLEVIMEQYEDLLIQKAVPTTSLPKGKQNEKHENANAKQTKATEKFKGETIHRSVFIPSICF